MLEKLFDFIQKSDSSQEEREAQIDLMILMMFADQKIAQEERDMLKTETKWITWSNPEYYLDLYIDKTISKVREVVGNEENTATFIQKIAQRLQGDELRQATLETMAEFMRVDGEIAENEKRLLKKIEIAFAN